MSEGDRLRAAERLLREHGLDGVSVRASGTQGEIAVLSVADDAEWARLALDGAKLAREVKALGFRYAAVELGEGAASGAEP